jgi:hypothetical protein
MDRASLLINSAAVAFSLVALVTSTIIALRQSRIMQHSNLLPILIDLFERFRSPDFKQHFRYVRTELHQNFPPHQHDIDNLPEAAGRHVSPVVDFFHLVGVLVANGIVDDLLVAGYMGRSVILAWSDLEPYVRAARRKRNDPNLYVFFEHLAYRMTRYPPPRINRLLKLATMTPSVGSTVWEGEQTQRSQPH